MTDFRVDDASSQTDREEIRSILLNRIRGLNETIEAAEPDAMDENHLQLRRIRELSTLAEKYRLFIKDHDLDEMAEDVDLLKKSDGVMEDDR